MARIDSNGANFEKVNVFGFPHVGRYGLAHSLLAWARCEIWCAEHGAKMLSPSWNYLRVGPYLRREADKREYQRLFRFPHYVTGIERAWLLLTLPKVAIPGPVDAINIDLCARQIVVFENRFADNFEHHFQDIVGSGALINSALRRMTKSKFLPSVARSPHIAIHVRMGDFTTSTPADELRAGRKNSRIPIEWYVNMLHRMRASLGHQMRAVVYSDGTDELLAPLLIQPDVLRSTSLSAVTDMLAISEAISLISSGSGFSMWGCYLGNVPRVCFPGQRHVRVLGEPAHVDLEIEMDFDQTLAPDFVGYIARRI